jgi:hypothetical protein
VHNLLSKTFLLKRGLIADKARFKYFKTHAQHNLQLNPYLIDKHLYLLIKCELVKYKVNLLEIATRAKTLVLSFAISAITNKKKLKYPPKKVIRASKIVNTL